MDLVHFYVIHTCVESARAHEHATPMDRERHAYYILSTVVSTSTKLAGNNRVFVSDWVSSWETERMKMSQIILSGKWKDVCCKSKSMIYDYS